MHFVWDRRREGAHETNLDCVRVRGNMREYVGEGICGNMREREYVGI